VIVEWSVGRGEDALRVASGGEGSVRPVRVVMRRARVRRHARTPAWCMAVDMQ
jgi:hypothetical protein